MNNTIRNICPLCKSNDYTKLKCEYYNVYSELISKYLHLEESDLLNKKYKSAKCNKCSTMFWLEPISKEIRKKLYTEILPKHPKGEDSTGKYFSIDGFENKILGLSKESKKRNRIINGYISSMKFKCKSEKEYVLNSIYDDNKNELVTNKLIEIFSRGAKPYSRHIGFRETELNPIIIELINKLKAEKYHYIEYGCPDWGPINVLDKSKFHCLSIIPSNTIFWDCTTNKSLIDASHEIINEEKEFLEQKTYKNSILGLFLVIDHIEEPHEFIRYYLNRGVSAIVILLEKIESKRGIPIQHLTAWSDKSLKYLAKSLSMNIEFPILNSKSYISAILTK